MPDNQIQEVLSVQVKTDQFKAGLDSLLKLWQQFVSQVGKDNIGAVVGAGMFGGIEKSLNDIKELMVVLSSSITTNMDVMATSSVKSVGKVKAAVNEAKKDVDALAEELDNAEKFKYRRVRPGKVIDDSGNETRESVQSDQLKADIEKREALFDSLNAIDKDRLEQDKLYNSQLEKMYAERDAIENKALKDTEQVLGRQKADLLESSPFAIKDKKIPKPSELLNARLNPEEYKFTHIRPGEEEEAAIIKAREAADREAAAREARSNSGGGIFGNLGKDLGDLALIEVQWKAIGAVIDTISSIITKPFRIIQEGEEYLKKTQSDAVQLQGALLSSVKYSADLGQNLKDAQDASIGVTKLLQDAVVNNPGLKLQDLQSSFKALSESIGGRGGVDTARKMVELTVDFANAIRGAGVDVQVTRRLVSELPQILNGTARATDPTLRALGLTNVQFKDLVDKGIQFGDLMERLRDKFAPFIEQAKKAKGTLASTEENTKLLEDRLAAIADAKGFDSKTKELQRLNDALNDPRNEEAFANWQGFADAITKIEVFFSHPIASALAGRTEQLNLEEKVKKAGGERAYYNQVEKDKDKEALANASGYFNNFITNKNTPSISKDVQNILDKQFSALGDRPDLTKKKRAPFDVSQVSTHLAEYRNELEQIKDSLQSAKQLQDELVSGGKENKNDANATEQSLSKAYSFSAEQAKNKTLTKVTNDYHSELSDIDAKAAENRAHQIEVSDAEIATQRDEASKRFKNASLEVERAYQSTLKGIMAQAHEAEIAALNETQSIRKANFEASIQMAQKEAEYYVAVAENKVKLAQASFSAGLASQDDVTGAKRQSLISRQNALNNQSDDIWSTYVREHLNTASGSLSRAQADNKYDAAAAEIASKKLAIDEEIKELDVDTYSIEQRMNQSRVEFYQRIISLTNEYRQAQETLRFTGEQISDRASGTTTDSTQHYANLDKIRNSDIASLQAVRAYNVAQLEKNHNLEQELKLKADIAQLDNQIKTLQLGKVQDTFARVNEIDSQNISPVLKNIRKRKILTDARSQAMSPAEVNPINVALSGISSKSLELKDAFGKLVFGSQDLLKTWDDAKTAGEKAAVVAEGVGDVVNTFSHFLQAFQQGYAQGGVLGGTGSVLSQAGGIAKDFKGILKEAGPYAEAAGAVLSLVGSLFTAHARQIVDNINKEFTDTMNQLSTGQNGINQTIQAVSQERQQAIQQLSGVKGGQDQLDKLLPQLDQQIAQLQAQQKQVATDFNNSYKALVISLDQGNEIGQQTYQNWINVNKQVYDYVNATGDAATATKYLSLTLQKLQIDSQQQLDAGEKQAISDAISLNQELQQRTELIENLNEQVFALQNQDSTERSEAGSVTRAQQVQQLQRQAQQQLQDLNFQITQQEAVVSAEGKVFDLATDIYGLHQRDTDLVLSSLQTQISGYQQLKDIIASITQGSNGLYSSSLGYLNPITNPVTYGQQLVLQSGAINVTIYAGDNDSINDVTSDSISAQIQQSLRSGGQFGS